MRVRIRVEHRRETVNNDLKIIISIDYYPNGKTTT